MADVRPSATGAERPTVLVAGDDEPMDEAICAALDRNGLDVERVRTPDAVEAARIAAPDLVLLVGDATRAGGEAVLGRLAQNPLTQVVPVVLLSDDAALGERLAAFRHGAVAVVPRSASVDEMARKVAGIARELPEREGAQSGVLGEATLDELMKLVKQELRSGILSVEAGGSGSTEGSTSFRLVLGAGKPVAQAVEAFVAQLRPLVSRAEPLHYELLEHADVRFGTLDAETGGAPGGEGDLAALRGLRVVLVVLDPVRSDALASELRARGATVVVTDAAGKGLERARGLDPEIVIIDAAGIEGSGFAVVKACRRDPRLRWASMLVAEWEELWPTGAGSPDMLRLASHLAPLIASDRTLTERARTEASFDTRLELIGPSRLLRALARAQWTLHVTVHNPRCVVDVDLSQGLVVGAVASREGDAPGAPSLAGQAGLAALLALGSGRVNVERRANPQNANVMAPVEEALALAAGEEPPLQPSLSPPSLVLGMGRLGAPESAPPSPVATPASAFDEAPTSTRSPASGVVGKQPLAGDPVPGQRAAPVAGQRAAPVVGQRAAPVAGLHAVPEMNVAPSRPQVVPRPRTMLGLAPSPAVDPRRAPLADPSSLTASAAMARTLGAPASFPERHLPPPARVPDEATTAAAPSPPVTVAPLGRVRAPGRSTPAEEAPPRIDPACSAAPASSSVAALSSDVLADVVLTASAAEPVPAPLDYDSFVIPDASMIPVAAPQPQPRSPPRRRMPMPLLVLGGVGLVLLAASLVAAVLVVPWLLSSMPRSGAVVGPPIEPRPLPAAVVSPPLDASTGASPVVAPPTLVVAPPTLVVAPPTSVVAPPTSVVAPPTLVVAPPTSVVAPPTSVVAPPTLVVALAPPQVAVAPVPAVQAPTALGAQPVAEVASADAQGQDRGPDSDVSAGDRLVVHANRALGAGNLREAEVLFLRALELEPRNPHALAGLARLHLARRSGRQALTYAEQAVAVRPHRAAYRVVLGDALALLGRRGEAQRAYRDALRMDPRSREARARLADRH